MLDEGVDVTRTEYPPFSAQAREMHVNLSKEEVGYFEHMNIKIC